MRKGINKAIEQSKTFSIKESLEETKRPCVFLSHKQEDKTKCREIAKYLSDAEIDYYLDEKDIDLQQAANVGNATLITDTIKKGIRNSTHMMVVVSEKTYMSAWVPFEIGYGHAAIIDKSNFPDIIKLSVLILKDLSEVTLPTFLKTAYLIKGTKSINEYIAKISNKKQSKLIQESKLFSHSQSNHPLDDVLNWEL